jgi:signal transduction histidine kinase
MKQKQPSLSPEILVPRLGEHLINQGLISEDQLLEALQLQSALKKTQENAPLLGEILVDLGYITRTRLDSAITEQVIQLRAALIETNQQLEARVQERTAELEKALQKLSELNQLKANFIANISHELRTPLTHIKGYQEMITSGDLGPLTAEQASAFSTIQRSTQRLERLIEDLILYATSERTYMPIKSELLDMTILCKEVVEQSIQRASDRKIGIDFSASNGSLNVYADREKISWVLYQLVDNAVKFTPAGGHITLELAQADEFVHISISDTGIGIPANRISEIFEPFHQLDGASTRKYSGTGLGLSLVKKILEAHESTILVQSELGKGSNFSFSLPKVSFSQ